MSSRLLCAARGLQGCASLTCTLVCHQCHPCITGRFTGAVRRAVIDPNKSGRRAGAPQQRPSRVRRSHRARVNGARLLRRSPPAAVGRTRVSLTIHQICRSRHRAGRGRHAAGGAVSGVVPHAPHPRPGQAAGGGSMPTWMRNSAMFQYSVRSAIFPSRIRPTPQPRMRKGLPVAGSPGTSPVCTPVITHCLV